MACVMFWNWRTARSTSSHSSSCTDIEQHHDVGADGKVHGVIGDDEGVEIIASAAGLECLGNDLDDVAAQRIHLGVELDTGDAIAEIDQRCARVLLHNEIRLLRNRD